MKWLLASGVAGPMVAAALMGPDLWFKLTFFAGGALVILLAFAPDDRIAGEAEEEMSPFMTTEQVLAFVERRDRRLAGEAAPQIRSAKQ